MNEGEERTKLIENLADASPKGQVVVPLVHHDGARPIGKDDAVRKEEKVSHRTPAESARNRRKRRQIPAEAFVPAGDRGASSAEDTPMRRWPAAILFLESPNA